MNFARTALASGVLASLVAFAPTAFSAEWHAGPAAAFAGPPRDAARAYLMTSAVELRTEGIELEETAVLPGPRASTVRFAQRHAGLPVFDTTVVVRVGKDGHVRRSVVDVARDLSGVAAAPTYAPAMARAHVASLLGPGFDGPIAVTLGVHAIGGHATLVYRSIAPTPDGGVRYDLDAVTGDVVEKRRLGADVMGRVFKVSAVQTPSSLEELLDLSSTEHLEGFGGLLASYEYVSGAPGMAFVVSQATVPSDAGGDYDYPVPTDLTDPTDAFAVTNTYYHTRRMRAFFEGTLGVDMSASSWGVGVVANVLNSDGTPMDNAAFSPTPIGAPGNKPNTIIIGQGTMIDFAYDSDVFLHEFTHYVAHNAIGYSDGQLGADAYGLNTFPGSIDEGTADYFACTVNGDSVLGETTLQPLGAERDLSIDDKQCPDDIFGEVHEDGKMAGSLAWKVREALGAERADPLVWAAMTHLTHSSSLGDLATGILAEANDGLTAGDITAAEVAQITAAVHDHGLDDCGRVLALDDKSRNTVLLGFDTIAAGFGTTCASLQSLLSLNSLFHFSKKGAAGARGVQFHVTLQPSSGGSLQWGIYGQTGEHVGFGISGGPVSTPVVNKFEYKVDQITDTEATLTIDETSTPPFDPAQTYYAVIVSSNCPDAKATVEAVDLTDSPATTGTMTSTGTRDTSTTTGAGGAGGGSTNEADDTVDGGGCGCRVAGDDDVPSRGLGGGAAFSALALVALLARRRRQP